MSDENDPKKNIKVSIDTKRTEELARENERLKMQQEQGEDKEENLADLKLQAYQKFKNPMFLDAPDKATLNAMLTNFISELAERANPTQKPSGTAPANERQYGIRPENLFTRKFYDSQNMIEELRRLSHSENPAEKAEAQQYLDEIFKKYALDKRSNPTRPDPSHNPNAPENLTELDLVKKDGFLVPRDKEDGDLGRLQKQWREERKRRMEGKSE